MRKHAVWGRVFSKGVIKLFMNEVVELGEDLDMRLLIDGKERDYIVAMRSYESQEIDVILREEITQEDLSKDIFAAFGEHKTRVYPIEVLDEFTPDADLKLGVDYSSERTVFRVWSPVAEKVNVLLFRNPDSEQPDEIVEMERTKNGVWEATVPKDLDGIYYLYELYIFGSVKRTVDIYSLSTSLNGKKSVVLNMRKTDPEGWAEDIRPEMNSRTDVVVYEIHVEDFTGLENSGVEEEFRGKFLGIVREGKRGPDGVKTALDHLKDLGVTHVQLLPIMVYKSCREDDLECYNWGYDPYLYTVPSGKYSTNPEDPYSRIREFKEMVLKLHKNGIRVILDVVFPHTYRTGDASPFDSTVPYYFYRMTPDGKYIDETGCGNTTATERVMMRKFVLDTLRYWVEEYHVDGFRFDQMGVIGPTLLEEAERVLHSIDPSILIYGEPWGSAGATIRFGKGSQMGKAIGVFNDVFRDAIRGSVFEDEKRGFVMGGKGYERSAAIGLLGSPSYLGGFTLHPEESVNYAACHDNHTLWDKNFLAARLDTSRKWTNDELKRAQKLAGGMVILALGVTFLHGGQDFCRTKKFNHDSYNAGLEINGFDWARKRDFLDVYEYHKGLIKLRRSHPAFRANDTNEIREKVKILRAMDQLVVMYYGDNLNGDPWKEIIVMFNGALEEREYTLPDGTWNVVVNSERAGVETLGRIRGKIVLEPLSMFAAWRG